jgi:hypothetical protein
VSDRIRLSRYDAGRLHLLVEKAVKGVLADYFPVPPAGASLVWISQSEFARLVGAFLDDDIEVER